MNKIAYLANPYPAISHTFIYREIETLRREGLQIATASINRAPHLDKMSHAEQQEAANTFFLREASLSDGIKALFITFFKSPRGFARMTATALSFASSTKGGSTSLGKALAYLAEAILLIPWLRAQNISHIHEHFANPTALVALLCKSYGGFSYSVSLHGPDIFYDVEKNRLAEKIRGASFVRCISHYCKSQVMRILDYPSWSNQTIVRCGVDTERYTPVAEKDISLPTLLCVGRLCPAKGQHILIESCAALAHKGFAFRMIFVGDGPDRESLEKLTRKLNIGDRVTFTGALGQQEVYSYYSQANIFVLPSFAEGVPVVLMEAMAMELPVVSTRITGIPELIQHGTDGLLATPGDTAELTENLERLLTTPQLGKELGRAARQKVVSQYNQQENNRKLSEIFKNYGDSYDHI